VSRLAVIEAFQHGEQAAVLLDAAGHCVQVAGPAVPPDGHPFLERIGGSRHRAIDVGLIAVRHPGQALAGGRVAAVEVVTRVRLAPLAADEVLQGCAALAQPLDCGVGALRRRSVFHRFEEVSDFHVGSLVR
jgi:hypothetical protein